MRKGFALLLFFSLINVAHTLQSAPLVRVPDSPEQVSFSNRVVPQNYQIQSNPFHRGSRPETAPPKMKSSRFTRWLTRVQKQVREALHRYIKDIRNGSLSALFLSAGISLLYGILHAAGPGHRKVVLFSYFSSHRHRMPALFAAGFSSAAIHALSAIALTTVLFLTVKRAASTAAGRVSSWTELSTWLFIALFGLILFIQTWVKHFRPREEKPQHDSRKLGLLVFFTSIVPCPAASMIMMITLQQKVAWLGILLVLSMSVGMGITVSIASLPALLSNRGLEKIDKAPGWFATHFKPIRESAGSLVMFIFGLLMSLPVINALLN